MDRFKFLAEALRHAGEPYIWAAKGPNQFDCSGLVTYAILAAGGKDRRAFFNADKMYHEFEPVASPQQGDLVFYGVAGHAHHVMIYMGCGCVYGSSGGNEYTTKPTSGQCVKWHRSVNYRPDLLGYRKLPND